MYSSEQNPYPRFRFNLLTGCFLLVAVYLLPPSVAWSASVFTVGGSNSVPSNTISSSQATLTAPADVSISGVKLTATFHPGQTSTGNPIPLQAGYVWVTLTRVASGEADNTITLFDFPSTYPDVPGQTACSNGGPFDYPCINTELNGTYVFDDHAAADFDASTIASLDGVLAPGEYHSSIDSLDTLIGLRANDATYKLSAASVWSGTKGSVDWQLELTTVPLPPALVLMGSVLVGFAAANRKRNRST